MFSSSAWNAVVLYEFYPPDRGKYRFCVSASAMQSEGKPLTYRLDAGSMLMAGRRWTNTSAASAISKRTSPAPKNGRVGPSRGSTPARLKTSRAAPTSLAERG